MLWWVLGAWTASGLAIPALWLLSMAGRRVFVRSPTDMEATGAPAPPPDRTRTVGNRGHIGRYLMAALSVVGAVGLLLISSFSDPVSAVGNLCASFADAHVPASQPAVTTSLIQVKVAVNPPVRGKEENGWDDFARDADVVMVQKLPPLPVTAMSASPRAYPDRTDKRVEQRHQHWHVGAYVARSSRGTWLFPPNANAGSNN